MDNNGIMTTWSKSEAGRNLQNRLSNEQTIRGLDGLLAKIDSLEKAVNNLSTMMQQAPGMVAMVADMADETYQTANANGVNIDERLKTALTLAEKLTAPAMVEKLDGLLTLADQAPGLVAMTMDMADETYQTANANGVNIDERLKTALTLAEKLTAPAMVEKLDGLLTLADQAPGLVAMTMDMVDDGYKTANANGVNIDERLKTALTLAEKLTAPAMVEKLDGLLTLADQVPGLVAMTMDVIDEQMKEAVDAGFDIKALGEIAAASNRALTAAKSDPLVKVGGIFGLLRALNDNDRQKGLGFLMNFLKHLGRNL